MLLKNCLLCLLLTNLLTACTSSLEIKPQTAADVQKGLDIARASYISAGAGVVAFCSAVPKDDPALQKFCSSAPGLASELASKLNTLFDALRLLGPDKPPTLLVDPTSWPAGSAVKITEPDLHADPH